MDKVWMYEDDNSLNGRSLYVFGYQSNSKAGFPDNTDLN